MSKGIRIKGYRRPDGSCGIRNHIAVISTVACANHIAELTAAACPDAVAITHQHGCDQIGLDLDLFYKTLLGVAQNGNVAAVMTVGLGCEEISAHDLAEAVAKTGKSAVSLVIQEEGGTSESVKVGRERLKKLSSSFKPSEEEIGFEELIIGLECGGSDFSSGIVANPALGEAVDLFIREGAAVIFCETTELLGAEEIIIQRSASAEVAQFILQKMNRIEEAAAAMGTDIRGAQPSPGNIQGGLSTIEEKSLGAICKIGSAKIEHVLNFADRCTERGLNFMDTPGNDIESMAGLAAGGAQIIIFTTGRGTPMGFATVPVLKVCASPKTSRVMQENIDVDLSSFFKGDLSIIDAGRKIFHTAVRCASGEPCRAEILGHREFGLHRIGPTL